MESHSQVKGLEVALTGEVCEPQKALFFILKKQIFLSEKTRFWYACVGIFDQMGAMVAERGETSGGWKKIVVSCLFNGLRAPNPSL